MLPRGTVCDTCNNYLAREVEKPILDALYLRERRFASYVPNKIGRIPSLDGIQLESMTRVRLARRLDDGTSVSAHSDAEESRWVRSLPAGSKGTLIFPVGERPSEYSLSRFIGKIGLEALAQQCINVPGGLDELVDKPELDALRTYVRRGSTRHVWPMSCRQIHAPDFAFVEGTDSYEVLHEYKILVTPEAEYFIVGAIFGEEFALNLGGPEIEGYERWLTEHAYASPLYAR